MNKNISSLASQAMKYAQQATVNYTGVEPVTFIGCYTEKLSELVVQQCCDMMIKLESTYPANLTVREIKKEFGLLETY